MKDKHLHWKPDINLFIAQTSLAGNYTKETYRGDMLVFRILIECKVNIKPPRAPIIKEVLWSPPLSSSIEENTDGTTTKNPSKAAAGGIFINSNNICIGCFSQFSGVQNALYAELVAAMTAIEISHNNGYTNLWLETDSQLVILPFNFSGALGFKKQVA